MNSGNKISTKSSNEALSNGGLVVKNKLVQGKNGKVVNRWSNVWHLFLTRLREDKYKIGKIITFAICFIIVLAINFAGIAITDLQTRLILEIINACVIAIFAVAMVCSIYGREMQQNVTALELREGYNPGELFLSRLFELIMNVVIFLLPIIIINLIIVGAADKVDDSVWYKFYISSLGWYTIMMVISLGISLFFVSFGGIIASSIVGVVLSLVLVVFAAIGCFITFGENDTLSHNSDAATNMLTHHRDTEFGIVDKEIFKNEKPNKDFWNDTFSKEDVEKYIKSDWQQPIENILGINGNGGYSGNGIQNSRAFFLSLGPSIFKDKDSLQALTGNSEITNMILDIDNYFNKNESKYTYSYDTIDHFKETGYDWGSIQYTYQDEPLDKILNKMEKDNKQYQLVFNAMSMFSNPKVMAYMTDDDYDGNPFYPTWGGSESVNGYNASNPWENWISTVSDSNINPSEIMFFKSFFYNYATYVSDYVEQKNNTVLVNPDVESAVWNNNTLIIDLKNKLDEDVDLSSNNIQFSYVHGSNYWDGHASEFSSYLNQYKKVTISDDRDALTVSFDGMNFDKGSSSKPYFYYTNLIQFNFKNINLSPITVNIDFTKLSNPNKNVTLSSGYVEYSGCVALNANTQVEDIPSTAVQFVDKEDTDLKVQYVQTGGSINGSPVIELYMNANSGNNSGQYGQSGIHIGDHVSISILGINDNKPIEFVAKSGAPIRELQNIAHSTAIQMIYNPFVQFSEMLNGVDYRNTYLTDIMNAISTERAGSTYLTINISDDGASFSRDALPEILYLCYFIVNGLLIWAAYAIFKKKIKL